MPVNRNLLPQPASAASPQASAASGFGGPLENTPLSPAEERNFRQWYKAQRSKWRNLPEDPDDPNNSNYDFRGAYKTLEAPDSFGNWPAVGQAGQPLARPDTDYPVYGGEEAQAGYRPAPGTGGFENYPSAPLGGVTAEQAVLPQQNALQMGMESLGLTPNDANSGMLALPRSVTNPTAAGTLPMGGTPTPRLSPHDLRAGAVIRPAMQAHHEAGLTDPLAGRTPNPGQLPPTASPLPPQRLAQGVSATIPPGASMDAMQGRGGMGLDQNYLPPGVDPNFTMPPAGGVGGPNVPPGFQMPNPAAMAPGIGSFQPSLQAPTAAQGQVPLPPPARPVDALNPAANQPLGPNVWPNPASEVGPAAAKGAGAGVVDGGVSPLAATAPAPVTPAVLPEIPEAEAAKTYDPQMDAFKALTQFGLQTMRAGAQPGMTAAGALAEGGLGVMDYMTKTKAMRHQLKREAKQDAAALRAEKMSQADFQERREGRIQDLNFRRQDLQARLNESGLDRKQAKELAKQANELALQIAQERNEAAWKASELQATVAREGNRVAVTLDNGNIAMLDPEQGVVIDSGVKGTTSTAKMPAADIQMVNMLMSANPGLSVEGAFRMVSDARRTDITEATLTASIMNDLMGNINNFGKSPAELAQQAANVSKMVMQAVRGETGSSGTQTTPAPGGDPTDTANIRDMLGPRNPTPAGSNLFYKMPGT